MKINKKLFISFSVITVICITAAALLCFGITQINHPPKDKYPIRGVDVSEYQGDIDWSVLSNQDIDFAFIKATEGSSYTDEHFRRIGKTLQKLISESAHIIFSALNHRANRRRSIFATRYKVFRICCRPLWMSSLTASTRISAVIIPPS